MLTIIVPGDEFYDEEKAEFTTNGEITLDLEHSLVSLSKWETIYEKPFLSPGTKTTEEVLSYAECMILTPDFPPGVSSRFSNENLEAINDYINKTSTATWINDDLRGSRSSEMITSELIYYWLVTYRIPFEVQYWHLNRLFTLIRVCSVKNSKPRKMSRSEQAAQRRRLNAERKAKLGTKG